MHEPLTPSFTLAFDSFLLDAQARQLRPATLVYYRQQLHRFLSYVVNAGVQTPESLTAPVIRAYLASLQARGLAPASVHTAARAVRAFSNFLAAEEFVARSPMQRVKLPKVDRRRPEAFTVEQVRNLLAAAKSQRDRAILLCLLDTGCRASEFVAWTVGDVNVMTGTVRVVQAKNRRERTVYLDIQARQALIKHLAALPDRSPTAPVWIDQQTLKRLLPGGLGQLLQRIGRRAGILPCGSHKFRRTFATWCLRNGMNVYDLKTLMGHSGLEMLLHYLDNDTQAAHSQYGAVDGLLIRPVKQRKHSGHK